MTIHSTSDVNFMRGVASPAIQWVVEPLKSETSRTPVPIPQALALELSSAVDGEGAGRWSRGAFGMRAP